MSWTHFWQVSTITFFGGMAIGVWLGLGKRRFPPVQMIANATPPTPAELHAGVFTQSDEDDDEPRPLQVGDEVTLYLIVGGYEAVRAMFDPHNPPRYPLAIDIPLDFQAGTFTPDGPRPEFGEEGAT